MKVQNGALLRPIHLHQNSRLHRSLALLAFFAIAAAGLAACRGAGGDATPAPTEPDPEMVFTAAAQTAEAKLTVQALTLSAPTATLPPPTFTPTTLAESPTPATDPNLTPTETPAPSGGADRAEFVADVTVIDGTTFTAGEQFVKTWQLKNAGTSTWSTDYKLVFVSGSQMGGPAAVNLSSNVPPGDLIDLSVTLTAPQENGVQRGFWMLQNAGGALFGIGPGFDLAFYVEINVVGGSGASGPTPTPGSGSGAVTGIALSVDNNSFTGECPHTFTFTAQVTTSAQSRVTLEMEAGASNPSYLYTLPAPQTFDVGVGTFSFSYFLNLTGSVDGWARIRTTAPNAVTSNQVNFTLTCE